MYEPWAADLEERLHTHFNAAGITFKRYGGALLHEPESISNQSGQPYKVFTPYWRQCLAAPEPPPPQPLSKRANTKVARMGPIICIRRMKAMFSPDRSESGS